MSVRLLLSMCASVVTTTISAVFFCSLFPNFTFHCPSLIFFIFHVILMFFTYHLYSWYFSGGKVGTENKAVFITGCDSGFGNELAKRLDSKGFLVFAGCLFPNGPGAEELKNFSGRLQTLYLDVTKDESVEKAVNFVKQNLGNAELWAIVNNAGIYKGHAIELTSTDVFKEVIEVNTIGVVRVTKAFLPLLRKSKGRVVNVTSLGGRISLIGISAYTMSKYAAVAFTQCLSQEMKAWGISAISIEPETFRTPMSDTKNISGTVDEVLKKTSEETLTLYGKNYDKKLKQVFIKYLSFHPPGIRLVIEAMESAVMDKYPNHSYRPRWNCITRFFWYLSQAIPYGLFEFLQDKVILLIGYPIPEGAKKRI